MTFSFSKRSIGNLIGVHVDLVRVMNLAITMTPVDFGVINGVRTCLRQHELFTEGASELDCPPPAGKPMGRHVTGHAVDFDVWIHNAGSAVVSWDVKYYIQVATAIKNAAAQIHVPILWGGDWVHFRDWGHVELQREAYPDAPLVA